MRDLTSGFKCFRADALRAVGYRSVRSRGYAFQVELTYRALRQGGTVAEVPIVFRERREGHSKMTTRIALEAAWRVAALRRASELERPEPVADEAQRRPGDDGGGLRGHLGHVECPREQGQHAE